MNRTKRNNVFRDSGAGGKDDIDLTPMLDVVFIMLIFFVVTASFLTETGLPINRPDSPPQESEPDDMPTFVVNINSLGEVYIEQRRVDVRALRSLVARHLAEHPSSSIVIRAHEQSKTDVYVSVLSQIKESWSGAPALITYMDS